NGMISFGAASGWSTRSGCGSKVSAVSASSITSRWPTWTPSKVPIATCLGRLSASRSWVTRMLNGSRWPCAPLSLSLLRRLGWAGKPFMGRRRQALERLLEVEEHSGVGDREGPDSGSPELLAVGVPEGGDQAPNV